MPPHIKNYRCLNFLFCRVMRRQVSVQMVSIYTGTCVVVCGVYLL